MKLALIRLVIIVGILLQLVSAGRLRNFSMPHGQKYIEAVHTWQADPSPVAKAALVEALRQNVESNRLQERLKLGFLLLADVIVIYFFWNHGVKKKSCNVLAAV